MQGRPINKASATLIAAIGAFAAPHASAQSLTTYGTPA